MARLRRHQMELNVLGPWSLATSKTFWEGFAPAALPAHGDTEPLRSVFRVEADWSRAEAEVTQVGPVARIMVVGDGDLEAAVSQTCRFLSLDFDARRWPEVGGRDPVMGTAQAALPGLRPCGFLSAYEAAAWAVLSQRIRIAQAAALRHELIHRYGDDGAFPPPQLLRQIDLHLPGRKAEYLQAVADAAVEGRLDSSTLRSLEPDRAIEEVRRINGLGPFAAELVVLRGANAPDVLPRHDRRLEAEVAERYGPTRTLPEVAEAWRPFRSWGAVYLRALREQRTNEISRGQRGRAR